MAMEESSTALARDMARMPVTETLGEIEPSFAAVHREHMKDEVRHLQIDGILVDLCLARSGRAKRVLNAALFKSMLGPITRPTRAGSGVKVDPRARAPDAGACLARGGDDRPRCWRLKNDRQFQASLFNRRAMPLTFGVFDGMRELDGLDDAMVGYDRR